MRDPLADALVAVERRLLSLERRFRDFASGSVRFLHQLLDVAITYDGVDAVADGDVLTYDSTIEKWINAAPDAGSGGPHASISVVGEWDGSTVSDVEAEWMYASSGYDLTLAAGGGPTFGIGRWVAVETAGIYLVTGNVSTASGYPRVGIAMTSSAGGKWMRTGDSNNCRDPLETWDDGSTSGSVSMLMPLHPDIAVGIDLDLDGAASGLWRLQVSLVHAAPILVGTCAM